jgi:uncharacterized protein YutE (UPF0331/DUF86 family)
MKLTEEEKSFLKERTDKKIAEIESYLDDLISFKPESLEEYKKNKLNKAACERLCEKIAEGLVDLAIFIVRIKEIPYNEEDEKAFGILFKHNLIDKVLCNKLRALKGMRDHIAHKYGEVDDKIVFYSINNEIESDVNEFISAVKTALEEIQDKK